MLIKKKFTLDADVFVSKKKKHVHIAFTISISQYGSFDRLTDFISNEWEIRKIFSDDYKIIYLRLIILLKWKFGYIFFGRKAKKWKTTP